MRVLADAAFWCLLAVVCICTALAWVLRLPARAVNGMADQLVPLVLWLADYVDGRADV